MTQIAIAAFNSGILAYFLIIGANPIATAISAGSTVGCLLLAAVVIQRDLVR